jgi:hypothetical protein
LLAFDLAGQKARILAGWNDFFHAFMMAFSVNSCQPGRRWGGDEVPSFLLSCKKHIRVYAFPSVWLSCKQD